MTSGWQPAYGGNLHILFEEDSKVTKLITPQFNTLTFINLKSKKYWHGVTHVAPFVKKSRYAVSYWLDEEESENESS